MQAPESLDGEPRLHLGLRIPLRDGIHLSATLYLPGRTERPRPAIVTLTPYIAQTNHDTGMYFAAKGFPFLCVDCRGRGNSEGIFKPMVNESKDGYDVVEWLAQQPYCNGKIAMWGGSYGGHAQWTTAAKLPPHLSTIAPVSAPYMGLDFPAPRNIAAPYIFQWFTLIAGRTSQDKIFWNNERFWGAQFRRWFESGLPFAELDSFLGNPSPLFQEWLAHPHPDAYWDAFNPTLQEYSTLSLPILTITGIYDVDQWGTLEHYRQHLRQAPDTGRANHFLVIGPWDHSGTRRPAQKFAGLELGPASVLDVLNLHVEWYDWTMNEGPRPAFLRDQVTYYVMGPDQWRHAKSLEAITERVVPFYLHSSGNPTDVFRSGWLDRKPQAESTPDNYVYDPRDISSAAFESTVDPNSRVDQRRLHSSLGKYLVYHSAPFEEPTEISGFFKLSIWLSIDQPDTDFRASVYCVELSGNAIELASDSMRARYHLSLREPVLVDTTDPLNYDMVTFPFTSRLFKRGERLRLVLEPINSIYSEKNYNSGGVVAHESMADARTVTVKLFHDEAHRSALYVPFGHAGF